MTPTLTPYQTITGEIARLETKPFSDKDHNVDVMIGSQLVSLPARAVPRITDGTVVCLRLAADGQPDFWDLPKGKELQALKVTRDDLKKFTAKHPEAEDNLADALFDATFSLPVLVHQQVVKMLKNAGNLPAYVDLSQYPCTSDGSGMGDAAMKIMDDTVTGGYLSRFGWANVQLLLRGRYGLDAPTAQKLLQNIGLSFGNLLVYPYLAAYALQSEQIAFSALDKMAVYHHREASDPNRLYAALFWAVQKQSFSLRKVLFDPQKVIVAAERILQGDPRNHEQPFANIGQGGYRMALQSAWKEMLETGYSWEYALPDKPGKTLAAITRVHGAIKAAGKAAATLAYAPDHETLIPSSRVLKELNHALSDEQSLAMQAMLSQPLTVVTGGPGHGKTQLLSVLSVALADSPDQSVMPVAWVVAPTSRAAVRAKRAAIGFAQDTHVSVNDLLTRVQFTTIHRALRATPTSDGNPGTFPSLVIVDEASMLDGILSRQLFVQAQKQQVRLVLIGDPCQLPPVGPSNVLRNVLQHVPPELTNHTVHELLVDHRRFLNPVNAALSALRQAILTHDGLTHDPDLMDLSKDEKKLAIGDKIATYLKQAVEALASANTVEWIPDITADQMDGAVKDQVKQLESKHPGASFLALTPYRTARQMNAMNLNEAIHELVTHAPEIVEGEPMVMRANREYSKADKSGKLYVANGSPATVVATDSRNITMVVDDPEALEGETRIIAPAAGLGVLFDWEYIDTVHAAQGGEASHVILVGTPSDSRDNDDLAVHWDPRALYTALSRVKDAGPENLGRVVLLGHFTVDDIAAEWNRKNYQGGNADGTFNAGWNTAVKQAAAD